MSDLSPTCLDAVLQDYLDGVVRLERSPSIAAKLRNHLQRFCRFAQDLLGHPPTVGEITRSHAVAFQKQLSQTLQPATVNNIMASLSGFCTYIVHKSPQALPDGNPCRHLSTLSLPPLEPRALNEAQVRTLKATCEQLPQLHLRKKNQASMHCWARPYRDKAMVYVLLSTGLRREELVCLTLSHLGEIDPSDPQTWQCAKQWRLFGVRGKGQSQRTVFLSSDARNALCDYFGNEWMQDSQINVQGKIPMQQRATLPLFLSARGVAKRSRNGSLSPRMINSILKQIGLWHDAKVTDPKQWLTPLRPHDLRHTFAFRLAQVTQNNPYELQRRLGHRSQRYIERYTNPPEEIAALFIEAF